MRGLIAAFTYIAAGAAVGCFSAYALIQSSGVEHLQSGTPWISRGLGLAGPWNYHARAHYLIAGRLPPAPGQLTEATAETDDDNQPLTSSCRYRLTATSPLPRWWSLAVAESASANATVQATADSDNVIREADGSLSIVASVSPEPGNWLKTPVARRLTVIYSAVPANNQKFTSPPPFDVKREACR
ncbi:DUF1214 domain-containing protein [Aestuariivirga sp.]|uniref:DUF1214 domain-containing protein n=1 Tax=Aestuariivirga sp. TaxID=2650926 RepID=UPI0035931E73